MMSNYSYACTLLIDTVIFPNEVTGKSVSLNTKHFDKYILQNVQANTYNSFYTVTEPNNKIFISDSIQSFSITTEPGVYAFETEKIYMPPQTFDFTTCGQLWAQPSGSFDFITYATSSQVYTVPRPDHRRVGLLSNTNIVQKEPLITLDTTNLTLTSVPSQVGFQNLFFNSSMNILPCDLSTVFYNHVGTAFWESTPEFIPLNKNNLFLFGIIRGTPNSINIDGPVLPAISWAHDFTKASGLDFSRNYEGNGSDIPAELNVANFTSNFYISLPITMPVDTSYDQIYLQFVNKNDIVPKYCFAYFYNVGGDYQETFPLVWNNDLQIYLIDASSLSSANRNNCVIQFYTNTDLNITPSFKNRITNSYFNASLPETTINITPGFYSGTDDLESIFELVVKAYAALSPPIVIEINYNYNNGKVSITSADTSIKSISFTSPINRFFGQYNSNSIEFSTSWISPNISDLFNDGQFNCIKIHCPQLNNASFIGMSDVICQIYPSNNFGEQIVSQNINFFVNFPDHVNLSSLMFVVTDNNNMILNIQEPIYLIFQIFCYNQIENKPKEITQQGSGMHGTMKYFH